MNLLEDSEQFFPVSAQASDEVLDEQKARNSPQWQQAVFYDLYVHL